MWHEFVRAADWFCLRGRGYQFWSGIGSGSPIIAGVFLVVRQHNCHVKGCWSLGHPDPEHGHPACRKHHSLSHKLGVSV